MIYPLLPTFGRRVGKSLSNLQKNLLENELPKYLYSPDKLINNNKKVFLEIGFGMGEHFINQIELNPDSLFIGAEVYLNGVARMLKYAENKQNYNFLIWPDNVDLMIKNIPDNCLDGIYILFPDPWHKRRYLKKRLFNQQRLQKLKTKLKLHGFIIFASDIEDYFHDAKTLLHNDKNFIIRENNYVLSYEGYIPTKYHQKAIKEGRKAQFIKSELITY